MSSATGVQALVNYTLGANNGARVQLFVDLLNTVGKGGIAGFLDELSPSSLNQVLAEADSLKYALGFVVPGSTPSFDAMTGFSFDQMTGWSFDGV